MEMDGNYVFKMIQREMYKREEELLKLVIKQLIGREAKLSDAKRLTKVYGDLEDRPGYALLFDGAQIGTVVFGIGPNITITFLPMINIDDVKVQFGTK
jgi:hypothetical protein